ncbi:uncharacterized protein LOC62_07G008953 [Vanrija pseudolonga]|uniref:Uncharacterized protein n=1 Tax=Vanrija pseudolonga TaxID=143232 RepID=A0AAF1BR25_9TREE|nr:hypothetical protein LOC62_07G008953 [Vanrija pseudolonga]
MLDHRYFPHVWDTIVDNLDWKGMCMMRATSRTMHDRVSAIMYRHIVVSHPYDGDEYLRILDPYSHKVLFELNRYDPSSARLRAAKQLKSASLKDALSRIKKHTRVIELVAKTWTYDKYWLKVLSSMARHAEIFREADLGPRYPTALLKTQDRCRSLFLHLGPRLFDKELYHLHYSYTTNVFKARDEFVILVTQYTDKRRSSSIRDPWRRVDKTLLVDVIAKLCMRDQEVPYSKITFVKVRSWGKGQKSSSANWDRFIEIVAINWERHRAIVIPQKRVLPAITFSHKSLEEFQRSAGMSGTELELFTRCPGLNLRNGPAWAL